MEYPSIGALTAKALEREAKIKAIRDLSAQFMAAFISSGHPDESLDYYALAQESLDAASVLWEEWQVLNKQTQEDKDG